MAEQHRHRLEKIQAEHRDFGEVKGIISAELQGRRHVAVGHTIYSSTRWKTFTDFLLDYIKFAFGKDWWLAECAKSPEHRHIVLQWWFHTRNLQSLQKRNENGLFVMAPDGVTKAFLVLAYDLYVLAHQNRLEERVVHRLRDAEQFQGARYELFIASTLIRAGFEVDYEDETDSASKHPELVATHGATGISIDVEVKSRHRPGVLGRHGEKESPSELKLGVRRKINEACEKFRDRPFVVFIELNLPPERVAPTNEAWIPEIQNEFARIAIDADGKAPFSLAIVTNIADHYLSFGETKPARLFYFVEPGTACQRPLNNAAVVDAIDRSLRQFGTMPNSFPDRTPDGHDLPSLPPVDC